MVRFSGITRALQRRPPDSQQAGPLAELARRSMEGAQLYSRSRWPFPRCHPGTRKSVVKEIINWATDAQREHDMLWLYGPAGVGKTAIAQKIAEGALTSSLLGAALFLSRTRNQNDPSRFWTSVSSDLAFYNPLYGPRAQIRIRNDENVLKAGLRTQFDELIVKLLPRMPGGRKLLIVIDGLDECQGEREQSDIIECICDSLRRPGRLPVIWMICSRPEPHLKRAFRKAKAEELCWVKELRIDDPEAQSDIERYLEDEFGRIARERGGDHWENGIWPPKDAFDKIVTAASGLFVFATTAIRFIGQPGSDPRSELKIVVASIDGSPTPSGTTNPLAFVDKLYLDILERSRSDILPTTLQLLGICAVCPPLPVLHFTQLVGFDLHTVHTALMSLHSIIDVPSDEDLVEEPLRYYHASFSDFLMNPHRSGRFSQDFDLHRSRIVEACLGALGNTKSSYAESLAWNPSDFGPANPSNLSVSHIILNFSATHVWDICTRIRDPKLEFIRDTLVCFDFRSLQSVSDAIPAQSFTRFLRWLYSLTKHLPDLSTVIRTSACSDLDDQFIERCTEISEPLGLESESEENELEESPRYALIGFETKTIIAIMVPENVMVYTMEDVDALCLTHSISRSHSPSPLDAPLATATAQAPSQSPSPPPLIHPDSSTVDVLIYVASVAGLVTLFYALLIS